MQSKVKGQRGVLATFKLPVACEAAICPRLSAPNCLPEAIRGPGGWGLQGFLLFLEFTAVVQVLGPPSVAFLRALQMGVNQKHRVHDWKSKWHVDIISSCSLCCAKAPSPQDVTGLSTGSLPCCMITWTPRESYTAVPWTLSIFLQACHCLLL